MSRTLSARQALEIRRRTITLTGGWGECVGDIDRTGVVFVWGNSGNGKTTAVMSLAKELSAHGRVLYLSFEEGVSLSMLNTLRRLSMADCGCRFQITEGETTETLVGRLAKPKSPDFIIIDSFQYMQISYRQYLALKERTKGKMLIFVSHADGKLPSGRAARSVMYDAGLKLWVEGHTVFSKGRFIGSTGECVLWERGATEYWGDKINNK